MTFTGGRFDYFNRRFYILHMDLNLYLGGISNIDAEVFFRLVDFLDDYIHSPNTYIYNLSLVVIAGYCILLSMYGLFRLKLGYYSTISLS